jgi:putative spermidine/putrescine transport system substrate-binding protein/spermidine/putrescine transport system substrate-binding protein
MKRRSTHLVGTFTAAIAALLAFTHHGHAADKTLRIIGWEGYMDASFADEFTKKTGCKIVATYCGSSDEMYAKIKAGGGSSYDLVTASGDLTRKLYDAGMLDAVDVDKVPNYEKLFPLFKNAPYNTFDGKNYGVSIAWGPDFLIYDPEQVTDKEASTWMTFFDPKFKGRISINDYSIFLADIKLWFYGPKDIFNIDAKELETKIKPKLMPLRPQIRKFWTSQGELTQLFEGKEIAMAWGWPVTVVQLQKDGFNVKATVPKEGTTGWSDSWMIIKGSPNKDIAQQWMNYMLEGEAQKKLVAASGYWPVSSAIVPLLSDAEKAEFHINDLDAYFKTIHFWETVPNLDQWNALWNEFKGQ